jgi:predicted DNA-binding transcriptional regulator AlpA
MASALSPQHVFRTLRNGTEIAHCDMGFGMEAALMNSRFLTENQVAERTQISLGTLRRWRLENRGPLYRKFGSLVRYDEEDLTAWQDAQQGGGSTARIRPASARIPVQLRKSG